MPGLKVIGLLHVLEQRQLTRQIVSAASFQRTEKSSRLVFPLNLDGIIIL